VTAIDSMRATVFWFLRP